MCSSAWSGLNKDCNFLELHDKRPNPKCGCQKIFTFTPNQYMLEGVSIKSKPINFCEGIEKAWKKLLKPALNIASPYIEMVVGAKTRNPKIAQATTNILKSISGDKSLSLTDLHGNGFRLKVL